MGCCTDSARGLRRRLAAAGTVGLVACAIAACAPRRGGVSPETRQRSEETYGRQQRSMDTFNQTPSEQAGERHEHDRPARPPREGGNNR